MVKMRFLRFSETPRVDANSEALLTENESVIGFDIVAFDSSTRVNHGGLSILLDAHLPGQGAHLQNPLDKCMFCMLYYI